ncbi:MAG: ATP-binding protein [Deltaproteobacteria bacterium]|nr:ATP-binding protein [Deltaproteobacteria bacterium]
MGKKRYLQDKFNALLAMFPVVAVIGPRQSGKSTFVRAVQPNFKYYDLESPDDYQLLSSDPLRFFELNHKEVIIDEAQQYPELFKVLRGVIDNKRSDKGRFILTGSSSPEIVSGLTESLAGRVATIEMAPFKAAEYFEVSISPFFERVVAKSKDVKDYLDLPSTISLAQMMEVWFKGGFPEPLIESETNHEFYNQWMENYVVNYVGRDIRSLFPHLKIHNFRRFLTLLSQYSGHQLNMSDMARSLEVSASTIRDYLDVIHHTFIWRNLTSFEKNALKKIQKAKKGFFRDQGILHYFLKIASLNDLLIHPVAGFSFESFVIEEIIRGFQATMATQIDYHYYRTVDKSEVDLVVDGPFGIVPFEIKLASSLNKRDLRALEIFLSDMKLELGFVINTAKRIERLTEKIIQIPVNYI